MNNGPMIFLGAFFALAVSWVGFVLTPQIQVGREMQQTNIVNTAELYPQPLPGEAHQGMEVYRANGCMYCHSQDVQQTGTVCDIVLTDAGTNSATAWDALLKIKPALSEKSMKTFFAALPKTILHGVDRDTANEAAKALKAAGAKADLNIVPVGPDITRGWGKRGTVAADYLYDWPVMLGSLRIGPDLANVGLRRPDANWQLMHLYDPQSLVKGSAMPPYRFLFETRRIESTRSLDALPLTGKLAPPPGYEVVPRPEASELVAYLSSLHAETPLRVAPFTVPPAAPTNAPAAK
ncbi:MAG TPA: cbb3-type cytochrome c oxidase subunit II [Verrucomicrobiae bacterium]|nr:cbb3-type cytochrome c oxidase subunit II [Verrucomicrobiae bacterium]